MGEGGRMGGGAQREGGREGQRGGVREGGREGGRVDKISLCAGMRV